MYDYTNDNRVRCIIYPNESNFHFFQLGGHVRSREIIDVLIEFVVLNYLIPMTLGGGFQNGGPMWADLSGVLESKTCKQMLSDVIEYCTTNKQFNKIVQI